MHERRGQGSSARTMVTRALARGRVLELKLSSLEARIKQGLESALGRVAELKARGLESEAESLAADAAAKRMLLEEVSRLRLGLERMRLRLEAMLYLGESQERMREVKELMKGLRSSGIRNVPELSLLFEELEEALVDLEEGLGRLASGAPETLWERVSRDEVERVLREAEAIAQRRERSRFPHPPGSE